MHAWIQGEPISWLIHPNAQSCKKKHTLSSLWTVEESLRPDVVSERHLTGIQHGIFFFHKNHKKCKELHRKKPMGTLARGGFFEVIHAPKRQFWFPPSKFRGEITRKRGRNKTQEKNEKEKAKLWLIGTGYPLTPFWQDDPTARGSGFFRYGPPADPRPSSWRGLLPGSSNQLGSNASCFVFDSWLIS